MGGIWIHQDNDDHHLQHQGDPHHHHHLLTMGQVSGRMRLRRDREGSF